MRNCRVHSPKLAVMGAVLLALATGAWGQTAQDVRDAVREGNRLRGLFRYVAAWQYHHDAWEYCAMQSDPEFAELGAWAHLEMARDYYGADRDSGQAVIEFQNAAAQCQPWPRLHFQALVGLGRAYRAVGRFGDAAAAYEQAASLAGQTGVGVTERDVALATAGRARVRAAVAQAIRGDVAGAETTLAAITTTFAAYDGVVALARYQLAHCYLARGLILEAKTAFAAVAALHPSSDLAARALERLEQLREQYGEDFDDAAYVLAPAASGLIKAVVDGRPVMLEVN